jgi:hypothetical protein
MEETTLAGRMILEWILREMWCEGVEWIHLTWDGDQWKDLENMVTSVL